MNELDKILQDNGIEKTEQDNSLDTLFNDPIDQLDDLFKMFGRIFAPYEKKNNIKPKGWRKDQDNK